MLNNEESNLFNGMVAHNCSKGGIRDYSSGIEDKIIGVFNTGDCSRLAVSFPASKCERIDLLTCALFAWGVFPREIDYHVTGNIRLVEEMLDRGAVLVAGQDSSKDGLKPLVSIEEMDKIDFSDRGKDFKSYLATAALIHSLEETRNRSFPPMSTAIQILKLIEVAARCDFDVFDEAASDINRVYAFLHLEDYPKLCMWMRKYCSKKDNSEFDLAFGTIAIWREKLKDHRLRFDVSEEGDLEVILDDLESFGDYLGANSCVEALKAGVPIEDILA